MRLNANGSYWEYALKASRCIRARRLSIHYIIKTKPIFRFYKIFEVALCTVDVCSKKIKQIVNSSRTYSHFLIGSNYRKRESKSKKEKVG